PVSVVGTCCTSVARTHRQVCLLPRNSTLSHHVMSTLTCRCSSLSMATPSPMAAPPHRPGTRSARHLIPGTCLTQIRLCRSHSQRRSVAGVACSELPPRLLRYGV